MVNKQKMSGMFQQSWFITNPTSACVSNVLEPLIALISMVYSLDTTDKIGVVIPHQKVPTKETF